MTQARVERVFAATRRDADGLEIPAVLAVVLRCELDEGVEQGGRRRALLADAVSRCHPRGILQEDRDLAAHLRRGVAQQRASRRENVDTRAPQHAEPEDAHSRIGIAQRVMGMVKTLRPERTQQPQGPGTAHRIAALPHRLEQRPRRRPAPRQLTMGEEEHGLRGRAEGCREPRRRLQVDGG